MHRIRTRSSDHSKEKAGLVFTYTIGNFRVVAHKAWFTFEVESIKVHEGLELAVDVRVGVCGYHLILLLQEGDGPLYKGVTERFLCVCKWGRGGVHVCMVCTCACMHGVHMCRWKGKKQRGQVHEVKQGKDLAGDEDVCSLPEDHITHKGKEDMGL